MSKQSNVLVFAYGSNLHLNRIRKRAPNASPLEIGFLLGFTIAFQKRSADGSAKADARMTGNPADCLWGVVYRLNRKDKVALDEHESLGIGYDEKLIKITTVASRSCEAFIYVARSEMIDPSLLPYRWYVDFVQQGALQHRIPLCYINRQLKVPSITDPNRSRRNQNRLICSSTNQ